MPNKPNNTNAQADLLPADYVAEKVARRTNAICLSLFIIVMAAVVGAFYVTNQQRSEITQLQTQVNDDFAEAARRLEQLEELRSQKDTMLRKAKITSQLVERVPRTIVLAELINHMPATLSLLEFDLSTATVAKPRTTLTKLQKDKANIKNAKKETEELDLPQTDVKLDITGVAPTDLEVSQFIAALNQHDLFYEIHMLYSESAIVEEKQMRRFRLSAKINQGVEVTQLEPTLVRRDLQNNPMGEAIQITPDGQYTVPTPYQEAKVTPDQ